MQVIKGKDLIFSIFKDGVPTPVCYATDFTINRVRDVKEISGPQGLDKDYIPSYKGYTIGISTVVSYIDGYSLIDIEAAFDAGTRLQWRGSDQGAVGVVHGGTILLTGVSWATPVRGDFTSEVAGIGCGPKTTNFVDLFVSVFLAGPDGLRLPGCPNPYPVMVYWYNASGGIGSPIGIANNNDDVVNVFNAYSMSVGSGMALGQGLTGCDFYMSVPWDAPFVPEVVFAEATPELAMSVSQELDIVVSPDQDNDQVISPGYA